MRYSVKVKKKLLPIIDEVEKYRWLFVKERQRISAVPESGHSVTLE
jgi:hypothetical protein